MPFRDVSADRFPFVSNHGHVLLAVAANSDARIRQIAEVLEVTERTVMVILAELEAAGAICRERVGRRNRNHVNRDAQLVDQHLGHHTVGELIDAMSHARVPAPGRKRPDYLPCVFCGRDTAKAGVGAYVEIEVTDPHGEGRVHGAHTGCWNSTTVL